MSQHIETKYESLGEYLRFIEQGKTRTGMDEDSNDAGRDWNGNTRNREHAIQIARNGWPTGAQNLESLIKGVLPAVKLGDVPTFSMDVAGAYPIAPYAAAGDPCAMVTLGSEPKRARVARFVLNICNLCTVSPKSIMAWGSAVLALVDSLENQDIRCEIVCCSNAEAGDQRFSTIINVKQAGDPLDIDRLAFVIAHPSMLRRLWFRGVEIQPGLRSTAWKYGYGHSLNFAPPGEELSFYIKSAGHYGCGTAKQFAKEIVKDWEKYVTTLEESWL